LVVDMEDLKVVLLVYPNGVAAVVAAAVLHLFQGAIAMPVVPVVHVVLVQLQYLNLVGMAEILLLQQVRQVVVALELVQEAKSESGQ